MDKKNSIRIIDIARMANVSVGTVDRVLHNRGKVSDEKRHKVEKVLTEINYEPNMVARFLASKKNFDFAILMPSFVAGEYWELVRDGFYKAETELKDFNVSIEYIYFDQFDENSFSQAADQVLTKSYAGVVIPTLHKKGVVSLTQQLDDLSIPYIFIDSNIPECNNLAYFGCDSFVSGEISARLLLSQIGLDGDIAIVHRKGPEYMMSTQIESREKGFLDYLTKHGYRGHICHLVTDLETKNNKEKLDAFLANNTTLGAITFNSRIYEVVNFFDKLDISKKIYFVGYDSIQKNVQLLLNDKVSYLISQRSVQQGYESIRSLSNHLIFGTRYIKDNYMAIDILIKENVPYYHD